MLTFISSEDINVKEDPDFTETHCHWRGCDREFHTQDQLVKVRKSRRIETFYLIDHPMDKGVKTEHSGVGSVGGKK